MSGTKASRQGGFTLIELMIVVAVIAILAAIAYPSYQDSVRKSRRGQAKSDMVAVAQMFERYHSQFNTYAGKVPPANQSPATGTAYYDLKLLNDAATQNAFTLVATPKGDQAKDQCGTLTLNQAGAKTHSKGTDTQCQFGITAP